MKRLVRAVLVLALTAAPFVPVDAAGAGPSVRPTASARVEDPIVAYTFARGAPNFYGKGPQQFRITVGDTMVWTNHDPVPHDVTFLALPFADYLPPGESAELTFNEPGEFPFHCHAHEGIPSMYGLVYVE